MASMLPRLDREKYRERAAQSRLMVSHETALERHLARVIARVGYDAARARRDHGEEALRVSLDLAPARLMGVLRPSLTNTAREFAQRLVQSPKAAWAFQTKADAGFDDLEAEIARILAEHTATRVTQITDAMRAAITEVIRRGIEEGWSETEIADAITEATGGEMADFRARRIARTETHTAANMGQFLAARNSPLKFTKEWLATEDARTRPSHAEANGQRVDLEAPFLVGDEEMMMPGDPNASPGNVINCRCTVLYEPVLRSAVSGEPDIRGPDPFPLLRPSTRRGYYEDEE